MKKKMYVQVPVTGRDWDEACEEAKKLAAAVEMSGEWLALTPFDLSIEKTATPEVAMPRCIEALLMCDALLLHPANDGIEYGKPLPSRGCMLEALTAMTYDIPIYTMEADGPEKVPEYNVARIPNPLISTFLRGLFFIYAFKENDAHYHGGTSIGGNTRSLAEQVATEMAGTDNAHNVLTAALNIYELTKSWKGYGHNN